MSDLDDKAIALREELRNGRRSAKEIGGTGENSLRDATNDDSQVGTTVQITGREEYHFNGNSEQALSNHRITPDNQQSVGSGAKRVRRAVRRPGNDHSGTANGVPTLSEDSHAGLKLFTEEQVVRKLEPDKPEGVFDNARKSANATEKSKQKRGFFARKEEQPAAPKKNRKTITDKEAGEKQDALISALESHFLSLDEYLWGRLKEAGKDSHEQPVWSDADQEELEAVAKTLVKWGKKNETAAVIVDGIIDSADIVRAVTVLGPRLKTTGKILRETQKPRARRTDRKEREASLEASA